MLVPATIQALIQHSRWNDTELSSLRAITTGSTVVPQPLIDALTARGVPVRLISALFLVCMAVAVAEAAQVVGVLLSTALLIGPPATAGYLVTRPGAGMALAAAIGVLETWLGIDLAYVSYNWPPGGKGWPVSFFITALVLLFYIVARLLRPAFRRRARAASLRPREA